MEDEEEDAVYMYRCEQCGFVSNDTTVCTECGADISNTKEEDGCQQR